MKLIHCATPILSALDLKLLKTLILGDEGAKTFNSSIAWSCATFIRITCGLVYNNPGLPPNRDRASNLISSRLRTDQMYTDHRPLYFNGYILFCNYIIGGSGVIAFSLISTWVIEQEVGGHTTSYRLRMQSSILTIFLQSARIRPDRESRQTRASAQ